MELSRDELQTILKEVWATGYKNDPASMVLTNTQSLQGPMEGNQAWGGLFSAPGVRPDRFSALPRVRTLARLLRVFPTEFYNDNISIVTGASADTGSNPDDFCGTPPTIGYLKQCTQTFSFGKWISKSKLNSLPEVGHLYNRADVPGQILNSAPENHPYIPDIMWRITDTRSQLQYELYMQGLAIERSLEPVLIGGNPARLPAATERHWIKEFLGLDNQIKTGHTNTNGVLCPSADSIVIDFNALITGTMADGRNITQVFSDLWYATQDRATQVNMDDANWAFVMRKEVFRVLTDYYAYTYATSRFFPATMAVGTPAVQMAEEANRLRIEMLQGQYLLIEGITIPVVFSDGLPFAGFGNNVYETDIYLVPLDWRGRPLLRFEYLNLNNPYIQQLNGFLNPEKYRVLNNGLYAMTYNMQNFCEELLFAAQMRLILETPFLAGRIDNVRFSYLADTRNATPGASLYVDGGASYYAPAGTENPSYRSQT